MVSLFGQEVLAPDQHFLLRDYFVLKSKQRFSALNFFAQSACLESFVSQLAFIVCGDASP
jgi:hypothetical protein